MGKKHTSWPRVYGRGVLSEITSGKEHKYFLLANISWIVS